MNQRKDDDPIQVNVWVEDERLRLDVQKAPGGESGRQSALALPLAELTRRCSSLRREAQTLERSAAARNLQNEIYTLQRIEKRLKRGKWKSPEELARVAELPKLQHTDQAIKDFIGRITELEHETALAFYDKVEIELAGIKSRYSTASADWTELLLRIYTLKLKEPDKITIAVFGEDHRRMFDLAKIYYLLATARNSPDDKVEVRQFKSKPSAKTRKKKTRAITRRQSNERRLKSPTSSSPRRAITSWASRSASNFRWPFRSLNWSAGCTRSRRIGKPRGVWLMSAQPRSKITIRPRTSRATTPSGIRRSGEITTPINRWLTTCCWIEESNGRGN